MARTTGPVGDIELPVPVDRTSSIPVHEQLERWLREGIRAGRLAAGTRLPSTRSLAGELAVSRGVVTEAYSQLAAEGYLVTGQGSRARVAAGVDAAAPAQGARSLLPSYRYHFHPGLPDLAGFPRDRWLRSVRVALRQAPLDAIGYNDPRGVPALRDSLASYLGRVRGAVADPEAIVVCSGFVQGFWLLCRELVARGTRRIALEDPGWVVPRLIAQREGLETVPIAVDGDGLRVEDLVGSRAGAVVVTAAHGFATGAVLSPPRRAALIDWAQRSGALIVEDDFDAEYRYDRDPVGALQGLAPERVVFAGSVSKRLAPGLRLGWLLAPSWLMPSLTVAKGFADAGSEVIGQLALRDFIDRGELDRHLRRMRLRYRRRRDALLDALQRHVPEASVQGIAAGLYAVVLLPDDVDESALQAAAAARGVGVEPLSWHRVQRSGPRGLLLGYGSLPEPAIAQGVKLLGEALRSLG